jgi:uncharacterized protein YukJ
MTLSYGFVKAKMTSPPRLTSKAVPHGEGEEQQYHLHFSLGVNGGDWDIAANVGTDYAHDLLKYKIVQDFHHPIVQTLRNSPEGVTDLTGTSALPALDFLRSGILDGTGAWRDSDVLDGSESQEPVADLKSLLEKAFDNKTDVYVFGRFYTHDGKGVHDVHMNQGSKDPFTHRAGHDRNDHNDIWQDGALMMDFGDGKCVAYFAAFTQQVVPTDELGNPLPGGHTISLSPDPRG